MVLSYDNDAGRTRQLGQLNQGFLYGQRGLRAICSPCGPFQLGADEKAPFDRGLSRDGLFIDGFFLLLGRFPLTNSASAAAAPLPPVCAR